MTLIVGAPYSGPMAWPPAAVAGAAAAVLDLVEGCVEAQRLLSLAAEAEWFIDAVVATREGDLDLVALGTGRTAAWSPAARGCRVLSLLLNDDGEDWTAFSDEIVAVPEGAAGPLTLHEEAIDPVFVDLTVGWTEEPGWIESRVLLLGHSRGWSLISVAESEEEAEYGDVDLIELLVALCPEATVPPSICGLLSQSLTSLTEGQPTELARAHPGPDSSAPRGES